MIIIIWKSSDVLLDGVNTKEYHIRPRTRIEIPTAEQDVEYIEIKGRDGSLTKKYGYKDIPLPINFYVFENKLFKQVYREAKQKTMSAKTLMLKDDDTVFYKIKSVSFSNALNPNREIGEFTVNFILDPFQYELDNPVQTIMTRINIMNPGYTSEPIITVHANGTGNLYINDQEITIKDINGTITIDSEMMNAYRRSDGLITNLNNHMIGDFPVLKHGNNIINFDGDISKIELIKNWRWV